MKLNFKNCIVNTIDWQPIETLYKDLANLIYIKSKDLDLIDIAITINKWEEVELTQQQVDEIKRLINEHDFFAFVKKWLLDFIKNS